MLKSSSTSLSKLIIAIVLIGKWVLSPCVFADSQEPSETSTSRDEPHSCGSMGYQIGSCRHNNTECLKEIMVRKSCELRPPQQTGILEDCAACFAWHVFASLSINARFSTDFGKPYEPVKNGDDGPMIWERWETVDDIFYPGKIKCAGDRTKHEVLSIKNALSRDFRRGGPASRERFECLEGTLVDQNGERSWLEVQVNPDLAKQIREKGWHETVPGMDYGRFLELLKDVEFNKYSVIFRTSWVHAARKDRSEFYIRKKWLFDEKTKSCSKEPTEMALVGANIWIKTDINDDIFWITFEHIRNTPSRYKGGGPIGRTQNHGSPWTFHDPSASQSHNNKLHKGPPPLQRTQVVRYLQLKNLYRGINDQWHRRLKSTVWRNYALIGTQWGRGQHRSSHNNKTPHYNPPAGESKLASSVLETACQPEPSVEPAYAKRYGCIFCHGDRKNIPTADTTFLLHRAHSGEGK